MVLDAKFILLLLLVFIAIVFAIAWFNSLRKKITEDNKREQTLEGSNKGVGTVAIAKPNDITNPYASSVVPSTASKAIVNSVVEARSDGARDGIWPNPFHLIVGFVTDFLDTLGVGSFATTTALFRFGKMVEDDKIPGTLNVGHTLPTILQALIYIQVFKIDLWTLWLLIGASVLGSYMGATFVSQLPKRSIQFGMGIALLIAVSLILAKLIDTIIFEAYGTRFLPQGGEALGLTGASLVIGFIGNFIFGALMTIGVGAYAPIMVMVSLLGMNETTAFPLMMGSCAFLMPVASYRFIQSGKYDPRAALGLTLLGLPGVAIAAWIVKSLPLFYVKWLVVIVVIYTACSMLYAASRTQASEVQT